MKLGLVGTMNNGALDIPLARYLPDQLRAELDPGAPALGIPSTEQALHLPIEGRLWFQEAYATIDGGDVRVRIGRQKFYTGTGYAYNPIDLFNRKNPVDPTYEIDGLDALLIEAALPAAVHVQGLIVVGPDLASTGIMARGRTSAGGWDLAAQYSRTRRERVDWQAIDNVQTLAALALGAPTPTATFDWQLVAGEIAGDVYGVGVHAEGGWAFVRSVDDPGTLTDADHLRLLVGVDTTTSFGLTLMAEYMHLGDGATSRHELGLNQRLAAFTGEVLAADRDTLFVGGSVGLTPMIDTSVYAIVSLNDTSGVVTPSITVDVTTGAQVRLMAYVPVGSRAGVNGEAGPGAFVRAKVWF
ncbi:MAG: hypothetical protein ACI9MC_002118 [Kiritimatiellia bacterium]